LKLEGLNIKMLELDKVTKYLNLIVKKKHCYYETFLYSSYFVHRIRAGELLLKVIR